jgi:hypothetical protein
MKGCSKNNTASWDQITGTLTLTVRPGAILNASSNTHLSFELLNPASNGKGSNEVFFRARYMLASQWTALTKLQGSVLNGGIVPKFVQMDVHESRYQSAIQTYCCFRKSKARSFEPYFLNHLFRS